MLVIYFLGMIIIRTVTDAPQTHKKGGPKLFRELAYIIDYFLNIDATFSKFFRAGRDFKLPNILIIGYSSPKKKYARFIEVGISALAITAPRRNKTYSFRPCNMRLQEACQNDRQRETLAGKDCPYADRKLRYI